MIDGQRVRQARELHRLTQQDLLRDVPDLTQPRLSRVETGRAILNPRSLEAAQIAARTGVTVDWLSRGSSDGLFDLSPHFRSRSRTTETTKAAGLAWANLINEAHADLSPYVERLPVRLETSLAALPQDAARATRRLLEFDALEPLPYLVLAVERLGVLVLGLPWSEPTVDAFCGWTKQSPTIALAANVPGDRLRWNIAHELGHLVLHNVSDRGLEAERDADAFAAELLTPVDAMRLHLPTNPTLRSLAMIKSQWGVSIKSLIRRARELGVVDDQRAASMYRQISARGWNRAEPGYVAREKPRGLRKKLELVLGRVSTENVARRMQWSEEVAAMVLEHHASEEELPFDARNRRAVSRGGSNVVALHRARG